MLWLHALGLRRQTMQRSFCLHGHFFTSQILQLFLLLYRYRYFWVKQQMVNCVLCVNCSLTLSYFYLNFNFVKFITIVKFLYTCICILVHYSYSHLRPIYQMKKRNGFHNYRARSMVQIFFLWKCIPEKLPLVRYEKEETIQQWSANHRVKGARVCKHKFICVEIDGSAGVKTACTSLSRWSQRENIHHRCI